MVSNPQRSQRIVRLGALLFLLAPAALVGQKPPVQHPSSPTLTELRAGFRNPPQEARLRCYWWWLNGNTDKATITHDLEEMKAKGFGGALLVDANGSEQGGNHSVPAGPTFGSPAWVELYTHALREADRLGLEITLNITSGWNLGAPDTTPEQASKLLTWTRTEVEGGREIHIELPEAESRNGFYRQIAVLAYPLHNGSALPGAPPSPLRFRSAAAEAGFSMPDTTGMLSAGPDRPADSTVQEVQNMAAHVDSAGTLTWQVPPGKWEVLRIGYTDSDAKISTSSGAWQGHVIDYMSKDAFNTYWNAHVEPLLQAAKPFHSLKYLATDSWELGGTNWTDTFAAEFKARRGYDPVPWLPVVAGRIVDSPEDSTRFLTDLRRTVADLIVANHYDLFAQRAEEHGLGIQAESGGPHGAPIDALETFRHSAVPQSEFWSQNPHRSRDVERFFTKEAASAANIYGQRFVAQEGETSIGPQWSESLAADLKPSFDMAITEGMNRMVWHEFASSPASTGLPGQEYFAGTHLNPKITWWNAGNAFFTYLNRLQFMMQQGTAVDDVLYFYGDNIPNFVRVKQEDPARALPGYDYDVTDEDALLHTIHMQAGSLRGSSGVSWKILTLPQSGRLSLAVLQRVEAYVREGGAVAGTVPTSPTGITSAEQQAQFHQLTAAVWGDRCVEGSHHAYGKGQIFCTQNTHSALAALQIKPDVEVTDDPSLLQKPSSTAAFDYVHRRVGASEVYFLRNGTADLSAHTLLFRADGKTPQLWDAVTGEITGPDYQKLPDGRVQLAVTLPPFGSTLVVFSPVPQVQQTTHIAGALSAVPLQLKGAWTVSFQLGRGAPVTPVSIDGFKSWTEWSEPGVRFFSGTATYRATVLAPPLPKDGSLALQFTDVREIARVRINGKAAGTVWAKPLLLPVDRNLLKPGANVIEIEVTNLWPNRIIGDLQPGVAKRYTETNITSYKTNSPLLPSGLIGPVVWRVTE